MVCRKVESVSWVISLGCTVVNRRQVVRADGEEENNKGEREDDDYDKEMEVDINEREKTQVCRIKRIPVSFTL